MYSSLPSFVLGFHGCDKSIGEKIISGTDTLEHSHNAYDWLGHGAYFWENNPARALEYAKRLKEKAHNKKNIIKTPFVIGAIIDPGHCLNLLETDSLNLLKNGYQLLSQSKLKKLPENKAPLGTNDLLLRDLDCAVIEIIHSYNKENKKKQYDTVRGVFFEGKELYPNAGFKEKNHIQICVRNPNCIKGFFKVRQSDLSYSIP